MCWDDRLSDEARRQLAVAKEDLRSTLAIATDRGRQLAAAEADLVKSIRMEEARREALGRVMRERDAWKSRALYEQEAGATLARNVSRLAGNAASMIPRYDLVDALRAHAIDIEAFEDA